MAPVLELDEVENHPHNKERDIIINIDDVPQPASALKLSRTPGSATEAKGPRGANTEEILTDLGYSEGEIKGFFEARVAE